MFERYTEKARRIIFFARYEASQYGSPAIECEHLLLGLLREEPALIRQVLGNDGGDAIHAEIEKQIVRRDPIPTNVEMPLSEECKKALKLAAEEASRLAHPHVGPEHLLLGLAGVKNSLAARVLRAWGLGTEGLRVEFAKRAEPVRAGVQTPPTDQGALAVLNSFLAGLKWYNWEQLAHFFAENVQFVDFRGKLWRGRAEIEKQFDSLFAPYAKKNVTFLLEGSQESFAGSLIASILWENVPTGGSKLVHRMTVLLAPQADEWPIFLVQVTPVAPV